MQGHQAEGSGRGAVLSAGDAAPRSDPERKEKEGRAAREGTRRLSPRFMEPQRPGSPPSARALPQPTEKFFTY